MTIGKIMIPLAAVLLTVFFFGLPPLRKCHLPGVRDDAQLRRLGRRDAAVLLPIMGVYAVVAFWNLGNTTAPQSFVRMQEGESVVFALPSDQIPAKLMLYCGAGSGDYAIEYSTDGENYEQVNFFLQGTINVFKWNDLSLETQTPTRFMRIVCHYGGSWLGEAQLLDVYGRRIAASCSIRELCDEQDTAPARQSFVNSTYFDEIFHARTAWENLHGITPHEITHPPLGKLILSVGISLFGMTPFGWRFMGTLLGVLMLPALYVFLKRLFGGFAVPAAGSVLMATDFMHYAQTRIATIDTYAVFFILLMYLCMYEYLSRESLPALALSGIFFGLGAASKWTAFYAGAGLAVLWALHWLRRAKEEHNLAVFRTFLRNCAFCGIFFVLIPGLIYYLSYLPFGQAKGFAPFSGEYTRLVLENQKYMLQYHVNVMSDHPYASRWYQWMLNLKPILYYLDYIEDGTRSSICAFVNPALCWGGLVSLFVLLYTAIFRRDRTAGFILIGYLAQVLPWVFVQRTTYAYHYFPATVFLVLALCYVFTLMRDNRRNWHRYVVGFALASLLLFVLFFPSLSGLAIDYKLASALMRWMPGWPL